MLFITLYQEIIDKEAPELIVEPAELVNTAV
jgi:hypothetical protein